MASKCSLYWRLYIGHINYIVCLLTALLCNNVTSFIKLFEVKRDSEMFVCKYGHESLAYTDSEVGLLISVHYKLDLLSTSSFLILIMGIIDVNSSKNLHSITSGLSKFWA